MAGCGNTMSPPPQRSLLFKGLFTLRCLRCLIKKKNRDEKVPLTGKWATSWSRPRPHQKRMLVTTVSHQGAALVLFSHLTLDPTEVEGEQIRSQGVPSADRDPKSRFVGFLKKIRMIKSP